MLEQDIMFKTVEKVSRYDAVSNSDLLVRDLILKGTGQEYAEAAFSANYLDEDFGGLKVSFDGVAQESVSVNCLDYFLHQSKNFRDVPLIKNNFLSDDFVSLLDYMFEQSLFFSEREPGNLFGDGVAHSGFFLSERNSPLCKEGYRGVLISGVVPDEGSGGFVGDVSLILGSYVGDGKFLGNSLNGIRLNTFDAIKPENQDLTRLRSQLNLAYLRNKPIFENFQRSGLNGDYESGLVSILTPKTIFDR